ncbi:hypothetical protein HZA97_09175 [Candidatus Woesearchaeota archaeon]|nr:hypothetical protein [Candidatus Woesearchaeota archaeon]
MTVLNKIEDLATYPLKNLLINTFGWSKPYNNLSSAERIPRYLIGLSGWLYFGAKMIMNVDHGNGLPDGFFPFVYFFVDFNLGTPNPNDERLNKPKIPPLAGALTEILFKNSRHVKEFSRKFRNKILENKVKRELPDNAEIRSLANLVTKSLNYRDTTCSVDEFKEKVEMYSPAAKFVLDEELTTGSKQLLLARCLNLKRKKHGNEQIQGALGRLYSELKTLEKLLEGTPTFGSEFALEASALKDTNPLYNLSASLSLANELSGMGGNSGVRPSDINEERDIEIRINPSYAPIVSALTKELFEIGVLPSDVLVGYAVNMVGKEVLEYGLPLILLNYFIGLTPNLPSDNEGELSFRDVHVYRGATVNEKTGELIGSESQLNIFAGVTGKIETSESLATQKDTIEKDSKERLNKLLIPFLLSKAEREKWKDSIYEIFGLSEQQIKSLNKRLNKAIYETSVWKTNEHITVNDSKDIRKKLNELYSNLESCIVSGNSELYFQLATSTL